MSYCTIYDIETAETLADGLQSSIVCDHAINVARRMAAEYRRSVIVEDRGSEECYRVTPAGHIWRAPKDWVPEWNAS